MGVATATVNSNTMTAAYLGSGVDVSAGSLSITAVSTDDNFARVNATGGGVAAGAGASADTNNTSSTTALIFAGSSGRDYNIAGNVNIGASHTAVFNSRITTAAGGVLSGSGAEVDHKVTSNVTAGVGNNVLINAGGININANNFAEKPDLGVDNIKGTTGGAVSGAGAGSFTVLNFNTQILIGDNASLNVVGDPNAAGNFVLSTNNDYDIFDKVTLTSGGALAGAGVESKITTPTNISKVDIGNADLITVGSIDISARGTGEFTTKVNVDTYGIGTVGVANSIINITPDNDVVVGTGARLAAEGNINLSVGTDSNFNRDNYTLDARVDSFAGSLIPIQDLDATATVFQNNNILIEASSLLESAGDIKLHAEERGFANVSAKAKGVSWISALGDLFGGSGSEQFDGTSDDGSDGRVQVEGTVRTGIKRHRGLILGSVLPGGEATGWNQADGTITSFTTPAGKEAISFTTSTQALQSDLILEYNRLVDQLAVHQRTGNQTLINFYSSEIARIAA